MTRTCLLARNEVHMEFSLDSRSIDEMRSWKSPCLHVLNAPHSPSFWGRAERRKLLILMVSIRASIRGEILEDAPVCHRITVATLSPRTASQDDIKAAQKNLEASPLSVVSSRESYPVPGRALRNLVASRILILYTHGDAKNMFGTIIAFLKVASNFKAPADRDQHRM